MCTNMIGKADAMSPQEQLRYKEAMGSSLEIPPAPVVSPQTSISIPKDYIALPNGKRVSPADYTKLQSKLKNRG